MERFDVAVIGGGVVGVATARRLALEGRSVVLIEKGLDILSGASKANSAILHTGFDAPAASLELQCMRSGYAQYMALREAMNLPVLDTGAMVVAWTEAQVAELPAILAAAHANGVPDASLMTAGEIHAREPKLAPALAAILVPGECIIDPWSPFYAYAQQILAAGGEIRCGCEVTDGHFDGIVWHLDTGLGAVSAQTVVNAAGLYGDRIDQLLLGASDFTIKPRRGQFVVFDKAAAAHLRSIILPVPEPRTKGVVLTRTIFGNLLVGPTAEETDDRDRPVTTPEELTKLIRRAVEILPVLQDMPVTATYAGLRPATERKEYRVRHHADRNMVTVGGIRSTGLTASLGLASYVASLLTGTFTPAPVPLVPPRVPNLAEHLPRDWQVPGYGEIICHCEMVTRREILTALDTPFPPADFGGLKRRTRCAMGRCQGFNCLGRLEELTRGRLAQGVVP